MQTLTLCENDITALRGALEIARGIYLQNAADLRNPEGMQKTHPAPGYERLAQQFDRQAEDAARLLETLDE